MSLDDPIFTLVRKNTKILTSVTVPGQDDGVFNRASMIQGRNKTVIERNLDVSEIVLKEFKFVRPLFSSFLDIVENTMPFEIPYHNWLEVTIRGIYDSKYYEHQLCTFETGRLPTRLAEFVYAWLGNFTVEQVTRQVKELEI